MSNVVLPRFYPIVNSSAWVARLTAAGARLIQLRIKNLPPDDIRGEIRTALAACETNGATLVVNDYWQLAIEAGAPFVHLGQEDLAGADLAAIRARGIRLGVSTHDHAELANALSVDPDYVALGPVYPTTLKVMPWAPQGLATITEWKRTIGPIPLVAIGGITLERAAGCFAAGADCVSVVSDVVNNPDPEARVRAWLAAVGEPSASP